MYIPYSPYQQHQQVCPTCGHCPTCGRQRPTYQGILGGGLQTTTTSVDAPNTAQWQVHNNQNQ